MPTRRPEKEKVRKPLRLWNEAPLNGVSLRSELDCEVTYGLSRVKMNAPSGALDSHHRTSMLTSKNKLRRAATSALTFTTFS